MRLLVRVALVLLLSWVFGYGLAFAVDIKTTNGPGGWQRDSNVISVQNPDQDIVDLQGVTVLGITGGGDMNAVTYDPTTIAGDAFDFSNHFGDINSLSVANDVAFSGDTTIFNNYSVINNRAIILANTSTTAFPITFDDLSNYKDGQHIVISKIDASTNSLTLTPAAGNTIAGEASVVFGSKGDTLTLHNDGTTDWKVLQRAVAVEAGSAQLHAHNEAGIFYNLSTTFRQFTSFDSVLTSTTVQGDLGTQSITVTEFGRYDIFNHTVGEGLSGSLIETATFLNFTTDIDEAGSVLPLGPQHFAAFLNISTGSIASGAITDLTAADGNNLVVNEVNSATPGAVFTFRFDGVTAPRAFHWEESAYDGTPGHLNKITVLNDNFGMYTAVTANATDLPDTGATLADVYTRDFNFPEPILDYVNSNGEVFVRITHTSTGGPGDQYLIDKLFLSDAFATANLPTSTFINLVPGDVITSKIKNGINGVFKIRHSGIKIHRIGD